MQRLKQHLIKNITISVLSFGLAVSAIAADYITEESTEQLEDNYTQQQLAKLYEPPRYCRRLNILREYDNENTKLYP